MPTTSTARRSKEHHQAVRALRLAEVLFHEGVTPDEIIPDRHGNVSLSRAQLRKYERRAGLVKIESDSGASDDTLAMCTAVLEVRYLLDDAENDSDGAATIFGIGTSIEAVETDLPVKVHVGIGSRVYDASMEVDEAMSVIAQLANTAQGVISRREANQAARSLPRAQANYDVDGYD